MGGTLTGSAVTESNIRGVLPAPSALRAHPEPSPGPEIRAGEGSGARAAGPGPGQVRLLGAALGRRRVAAGGKSRGAQASVTPPAAAWPGTPGLTGPALCGGLVEPVRGVPSGDGPLDYWI